MVAGARQPIAIVGMACLVPGARGTGALWERLVAQQEPFATLPLERWDPDVYAADLPPGRRQRFDWGALVEEIDVDWRALQLPPLQAERMHRVEKGMLATMSEALSDAGITPRSGPCERGQVLIAASTLGPDPGPVHGPRPPHPPL